MKSCCKLNIAWQDIELVVFDLDGTVVDSAINSLNIVNRMLQRRSIDDEVRIEQIRGLLSYGAAAIAGNWIKTEEADRLAEEFRTLYKEEATLESQVYPGAKDFLAALRRRNIKCAICSNKPIGLCLKVLEDTGLQECFQIVLGGDSLKEKKPSAAPLIEVARIARTCIERSLFLGDSQVDWMAANSAGMAYLHHKNGYERLDKNKQVRGFDYYALIESSQ